MAKKYGKWETITRLSEGGQGRIELVRAENDIPGGTFALKLLKNKERIGRFRREIESGWRLSHPNVLQVVDYDLDGTSPYFVSEFCALGSLGGWKELFQLAVVERLKLFAGIVRGVAHAHSKGIVHRDLKPQNIFLKVDQTPMVGDFGICFVVEDGERFTLTDEAVGPRLYIAPELEDGHADKVTFASDVYSLGKLLYWMIAGKIFARERHRQPEFDLTQGQQERTIFFIYELLDGMIVRDPERRQFADANGVGVAVETALRRIEMQANPIGWHIPQMCRYCGVGAYKKIYANFGNSKDVEDKDFNLGMQLINAHQPVRKWLFLACDYCGNVQIFRPDQTKNPAIWDPILEKV